MDINKFIDGQMAAWARNDMIGMLTDAGQALEKTGLKVNGSRYQDVPVGPLLMKAAAALEECWKREGLIQAEAKPENPGDVVVKIPVPDRWPMTEAGQRRAAQAAGERITIRREDGGVTLPGNFDHEAAVQKLACYEDICPDPDALRGRAWAPESRCQTAAMRAAAEDIRGRLLAVSKAMRRWEAELYVGGIAVGVALEEAADLLGGVPPEEYRDEK